MGSGLFVLPTFGVFSHNQSQKWYGIGTINMNNYTFMRENVMLILSTLISVQTIQSHLSIDSFSILFV